MRLVLMAPALAGLFLSSGCDSTTEPSPPGIETSLSELSRAVTEVQTDYVEANRSLLTSLDAFTPYIQGNLLATPSGTPARLSPSVLGRTYTFDGAAYQDGGIPGAPTDGVRFLIYEVNASGAPLLDHALGYLEIRSGVNAAPVSVTVRVVRDAVAVMELHAEGESLSRIAWQGALATPSGASPLAWGGDVLGDQHTFQAQLPQDVRIFYSVLGEGTTPENVLVQALRGLETLQWEFYADITALPDGNIMEGPVRVATKAGSHLAACMSGTLDMPVFQSAAAGDCVYFGLTAVDVSTSDLNALQGSYLVLRNLYVVSRRLLETGVSGLGPAS
jgi:hypothetical protein